MSDSRNRSVDLIYRKEVFEYKKSRLDPKPIANGILGFPMMLLLTLIFLVILLAFLKSRS